MNSPSSTLPSETKAAGFDFPSLAKCLRQFLDSSTTHNSDEWGQFDHLLLMLENKLLANDQNPDPAISIEGPQFVYNAPLLGSEETNLKKRVSKLESAQAEKRSFWLKRLKRQVSASGIVEQYNAIELDIRRDIKTSQTGNPHDYFTVWALGYFETTRTFYREWKEYLTSKLNAHFRNDANQGYSEKEKMRRKILEGLRRESVLRSSGLGTVTQLPWTLLPVGEFGRQALRGYMENFQRRNPRLPIQFQRIEFAYELSPKEVFVGRDEFDGYFAFTFEASTKVLLEHPFEGNAAYIFSQDWRFLSRLTKSTLLENYSGSVQRVIHRNEGNWREKLRLNLNR